MANKTLTYQEIVARLADRTKSASAKAATAGSGAPGTPSTQVTEKDPQDMGKVGIPKDPNSAPAATNLPGSGSDTHPVHNKDVTAVKSVGATSAKETVTDDNGAGAAAKAAKVVASIRNLRDSINKSAATAKTAETDDKKPHAKSPADAGKPAEHKPAEHKPAEHKYADTNGPIDDGKHTATNSDKAAQGPKAKQVTEKDPQEEPKPSVREDAITGIPENADTNESTEGNENKDKAAALDFDPSFHFKLASVILADDNLRQQAEAKLQEAFGAEVAADIVKAAATMEDEANLLVELEAAGAFEAEELWKSASETEKSMIIKLAALHDHNRTGLSDDMCKQAYDMGAAAGADEMDAADAAADTADAAPVGGDVTPEDILVVLQHLVESGQIDEQTAQAILAELGAADSAEGAEAPDQEVADMAEKAASVVAKLSAPANK